MKQKTSFIAAAIVMLFAQSGTALATDPRHKPSHAKKTATAKRPAPRSTGYPPPCQTVNISPQEDREVIILKLTQRMDCIENKLNFLSEQMSMQTGGVVQPFVEKPKEFVIKYPRDPEEP